MKKLLLIGQLYSIFTEPLHKAFSQFGFEVTFLDYWSTPILMPYTIPHRIVGKLPHTIRNAIIARENKTVNEAIVRTARSLRPDLVLVSKGKNISTEVLDTLKDISITANWYPETMDHWERIQSITPHYTYFFNFDPVVVGALKALGHSHAHYLPFCADIPKDAEFPGKHSKYNVTFVGSFDRSRYHVREKVLQSIQDLGLTIWGNKAWKDTSLAHLYRGYPSSEEMGAIHRESKIVIGMHVTGIEGTGVNVRPFETTAQGAFLLNHDERRDIFNLFREGEEFVSFHDECDIRGKVEYYLNHSEERERIARAGFEKTRAIHTYTDRVRKILDIAGLL